MAKPGSPIFKCFRRSEVSHRSLLLGYLEIIFIMCLTVVFFIQFHNLKQFSSFAGQSCKIVLMLSLIYPWCVICDISDISCPGGL